MSRFIDFDAAAKRLPSVDFRLNGKDYSVKDLPPETFDAILAAAESLEDGASVDEVNAKQLSILTGAPVDEFLGLDVRLANKVITDVMDELRGLNRRRGLRKKH